MDFEKLKPWNWFKHENDETTQIPVAKTDAHGGSLTGSKPPATGKNITVGSLMQLHNEMDRLFEDVWRSFGISTGSRLSRPTSIFSSSPLDNPMLGDYRAQLDVSGNENAYEVSIDLPGLSEDDIQIELNGNTLTIKGCKEEKKESKDKQYYRIERSVGSFQRTLSLPEDAFKEDISASMKNGLLEIKIPRKALAKENVKRIAIST